MAETTTCAGVGTPAIAADPAMAADTSFCIAVAPSFGIDTRDQSPEHGIITPHYYASTACTTTW